MPILSYDGDGYGGGGGYGGRSASGEVDTVDAVVTVAAVEEIKVWDLYRSRSDGFFLVIL